MLRKNLKNLMDHIWQTHMQTLMKRKRSIGISQIIDSTIYEWYSERGMEVPNWKMKTDPDWWIEYLEELEKETS
tara:strand:- start:271 stop:492 length:222 start_codon:yes stop_codon:yes gene_type:complete